MPATGTGNSKRPTYGNRTTSPSPATTSTAAPGAGAGRTTALPASNGQPNFGPRSIPTNGTKPAPTPMDPSLQIQNQWQGMRSEAISDYNKRDLSYNPYMAQTGPQMEGMNYNPYRQAATNAASAQAGNQFVNHQAQLQQAGGLSGSDRIKAFHDFNRSKIQGTLGANQQYDQLQSQNGLDVGRFNSDRAFDVGAANMAAQNDANQFGAMSSQRRQQNLYNDALNQRNLNRQLDASRLIGQAQMKGNNNLGGLLGDIFDGFDTLGSAF